MNAELETPLVNQEPEVKPEIDLARIDLNALWVVRRLHAKGYEAYLTGGCVRDLLLGKEPKDFDVATSAKPEEIQKIFRNCRLIGRRFLLAHIFFPGGKIIETATFRANPTDVQEDMPEDLLVTQDNVYGNLEEDAKRRDLTINGLFYDPIAGKVIDYVGGRADLETRTVRTIGEPDIRFQEDPVRILRAIKFASRLDFQIEENSLAAMSRHAEGITRCAPARVQEEIVRLLTSGFSEKAFGLCHTLGILNVLMPELVEALNQDLEVGPSWASKEGVKESLSSEHRYNHLKALLKALDETIARDANVPTCVAFSVLLLPAYLALEKSTQNERHWIDKLCVAWAERIRLTRHDQDRLRLLLSAIFIFSPEKLEKKSAQYMVRKSWFKEALLLYILDLVARGQSLESVGVWKALAEEAGKPYRQDRRGAPRPRVAFNRRRPNNRRWKQRGRPAS